MSCRRRIIIPARPVRRAFGLTMAEISGKAMGLSIKAREMNKYFIAICCMLSFDLLGQEPIKDSIFQNLATKPRPLYFDTKNNRYFGCGLSLDCPVPLFLIFKDVFFYRKKRSIKLTVYINPVADAKDTIGMNTFRIFVAKPKCERLESIHILADVSAGTLVVDKRTTANPAKGYVNTTFKFKKGYRLYIELPSLAMIEYNLSQL